MAIMKNTHEVFDNQTNTVCHEGDLSSCRTYVNNATYLFNLPRSKFTVQSNGMSKSKKNHPTSR